MHTHTQNARWGPSEREPRNQHTLYGSTVCLDCFGADSAMGDSFEAAAFTSVAMLGRASELA